MTTVGYAYDALFLEHDLPGHPEHAGRLRAVMQLLAQKHALESLQQIAIVPATFDELCELHDPAYVSQVYSASESGQRNLNPDTYLTRHSFDAAATAAGAAMSCVRAVQRGDVQRAFALVRPPGHHAFADHGEGFCLFNNVAFAAHAALGKFGPSDPMWSPAAVKSLAKDSPRAMIVDFDVHHGNGTQGIFYEDARVLVASLHQYGHIYPGTGGIEDIGAGPGRGSTLNVPMPAGAGDTGYARAFAEIIVPAARRFKPSLLLVSAGFDAHWRDPLASMNVSLGGFAAMLQSLCALSEELCGGKLVAVLEGGYDLDALSYGVLNALRIMQGHTGALEDPLGPAPEREADAARVIAAVRAAHGF